MTSGPGCLLMLKFVHLPDWLNLKCENLETPNKKKRKGQQTHNNKSLQIVSHQQNAKVYSYDNKEPQEN